MTKTTPYWAADRGEFAPCEDQCTDAGGIACGLKARCCCDSDGCEKKSGSSWWEADTEECKGAPREKTRQSPAHLFQRSSPGNCQKTKLQRTTNRRSDRHKARRRIVATDGNQERID